MIMKQKYDTGTCFGKSIVHDAAYRLFSLHKAVE